MPELQWGGFFLDFSFKNCYRVSILTHTFMIPLITWKTADAATKEKIMRRAQADMESIQTYVKDWITKVKNEGDAALLEYIRKFDDKNFESSRLRVSPADIKESYEKVAPKTLAMIKEQIRISRAFHERQVAEIQKEWSIETVPGVVTGSRKVPVDAAGLYVPAGKAPLPTVAQILTVAASSAGVPRKVVCFAPTGNHYEIIVAANEAGADEIYRVGGIAGIAALALGTETIKPVNVIAGPGYPYVQSAKLQLFGKVGIDMLSGPSEALIIADETANPKFVAADILARCEHGGDSAGVAVTNSKTLAEAVQKEVERQTPLLNRQEYIQASVVGYSGIILVDTEEEMIDFANEYSAEHLEIQTKNPRAVFDKIRNAGSVFIGNYAPVAVGDYASGTNHCLPTGVAPKFSSPVGVETFMKNMEFQELTAEGLKNLQPIVNTITAVEGLDAHNASVNIRFE